MKAKVFDITGKKVGEADLAKEIFEVKVHPHVLRTTIEYLRASERQPLAHTKTRGERRGGGRKPWKQKGTGNARHSSRRSPIWRKGGVTFGPRKDRNFTIDVNAKERRQAFLGALSKRAEQDAILIIKELPTKEIKTKPYADLFKKLPIERRALFVMPAKEKNGILSVNNVPNIFSARAHNLNALDILSHQQVVFTEEALKELQTLFGKKSRSKTPVKTKAKTVSAPKKSTPAPKKATPKAKA
ncbi:50S ribosomal protein L4 [Patescibacteria group bacterium]